MAMPVDARGWNPRAMPAYEPPPPPPPPPEPEIKFVAGFVPAKQSSLLPANFASPLIVKQPPPPPPPPPPLLSQELANEGRALAKQHGVGNEQPADPRAQIIDLSKQTQEVDQQASALVAQTVDIDGAKQRIKNGNEEQTKFFQQVTGGLDKAQLQVLQPLAVAASESKGSDQVVAQAKFARELETMLTPEQRKTLLGLNREAEDAQLHLRGQQIAERIQNAQASNAANAAGQRPNSNEALSQAMADGRAFLAERQRVEADRDVQGLYATVMTPELQEKLAQPKQEMVDATNNLQQHPDDAQAKTRIDQAKTNFDTAFDKAVNPQDREALKGFEAEQNQRQSLASMLGEEAAAERNYYEQRDIVSGTGSDRGTTDTQQRQYELAKSAFELTQHNRGMRDLGVQASATTDADALEKLNGQIDAAMIDSMRRNSDLTVQRHRLEYDTAVAANDSWVRSAQAAPPSAENAKFLPAMRTESTGATVMFPAAEVSPTQKAVNDALTLLDAAKKDRADLEQSLQPPAQEKKSGWDYALDIIAGVGEVIGGVVTMAFFGWTGIGAVAGGAIVVDGLFRLGHSISDAANGTVTAAPLSRGLQMMGMNEGAANRVDTGVSLLATAPVGIGGAALTVVKSANILLKGSGVVAGVMVLDGAQAQGRYALANQNATPITITQLTHAGLTPTQANYVLAAGNMVATGGLAAAAARRGPGPVHQNFKQFNTTEAAASKEPVVVRSADWYTRNSPKEVREAFARQVLGPDAAAKDINELVKSMKPETLVVLRDGVDGDIIAGGSLRQNSTGSLGRDGLNNPIQRRAAELKNISAADDLMIKQVINAAALGAQEFSKQRTMFWQTQNPDETGLPPETELLHERIKRDAPDTLRPLMGEDGFGRVKRAFQPEDKPWPATPAEELHALYKVPQKSRVNWPEGTRDLIFETDLKYKLSLTEKAIEPLHEQSYFGWVNTRFNLVRMAIDKWEQIRGRPQEELLHADNPPNGPAGEPRDITLYRPGALRPEEMEPRVQALAKADVKVQRQFGDLASVNLDPLPLRIEHAANKMKDRYVFAVDQLDPELRAPVLVGSASLVKNFRGFKGSDTTRFPFLETQDTPKPGTMYLADVYGTKRGAGRTAVLDAEQFARDSGARYLEFITQWQGAQAVYNKLGAYARGTAAPENAAISGLEINGARFAADAGRRLYGKPVDELPEPLRETVANATSPDTLQQSLDAMGGELYDFVGRTPDGMMLVSYRIDYGVPTNAMWGARDAAWLVRNRLLAPAAHSIKEHAKQLGNRVGPQARQVARINPYGLPRGIEPTTARANIQTGGYALTYATKQIWGAYRGAVADAAAVQAAAGDARIVHDDDRAIRPFNGVPGSDSVALYFPWTDTLVSVWRTDWLRLRGPAPIDPSGLQPLLRASAPMTDPTGPKGAGLLSAGRFTGGEFNVGIRWFGNNDGISAVSAASIKIAAVNGNLRFDVPIQSGGPKGVSVLGSVTDLMPSLSHAFYYHQGGVIMRNLHVTLSGSAQTSMLGQATKENAYRYGNRWTLGSSEVSGGTGFFLTLNPAYGEPNLNVG